MVTSGKKEGRSVRSERKEAGPQHKAKQQDEVKK